MELSDRRDATPSTPYTRSRDAEDGMGLHSTFRPQERSSWGLRGLLGVLAAGALAVWVASFVLLAQKPPATYSVEKSPNDDQQYRVVFLPNDLEVLLVSDPTTKVSSAAMDVKVGPSVAQRLHPWCVCLSYVCPFRL